MSPVQQQASNGCMFHQLQQVQHYFSQKTWRWTHNPIAQQQSECITFIVKFTTYRLLQTDFVDTVRWSCSSSAIVPPKSYSFLLLLLLTTCRIYVHSTARWYMLQSNTYSNCLTAAIKIHTGLKSIFQANLGQSVSIFILLLHLLLKVTWWSNR